MQRRDLISRRKPLAMRIVQLGTVSLCGALLWACASQPEAPSLGPTLGDLSPIAVPVETTPVPEVPLDQIEQSYRAALDVVEDPDIRQRIAVRLADIEMVRSEQRQLDNLEQKEFFSDAIELYRGLLQEQSGQALAQTGERPRLMYQLAKAYALDGRIQESTQTLDELVAQYPESEFAAEANFRRAEVAFSEDDYARAERLYDRVLAAGQTPFYSNALYMHGWSLFKQGDYRRALQSFTLALDDLLYEGVQLEQLSQSRQNLAADTLRIMAIAFSYLEGPQTITDLYAEMGPRHYQYMLYQQLGDFYLDNKRYRDSADAYLQYAERFPDTDQAPLLAVQAIEAYERGNFPSLVRPAKEAFVLQYGVNSEFWQNRSLLSQEPLLPYLHQFLDELASYYHARAQNRPGETAGSAQQDFLQAADYYQQFIDLFPQDPALPEMTFLMAEAYYEGQAWVDALVAYEKVAYQLQVPEHGAEAGYSAILTLDKILAETPRGTDTQETAYRQWHNRKIDSAIAFADTYPTDERAPAVLADAAERLFQDDDLQAALELATRLTEWQPEPEAKVLKTAWLVRAHSLFDLDLFSAAEDAYRQALNYLAADDQDRPEVVERIAASMYKQAEHQLAGGDRVGAVEQLLSIREVAPGTSLAINSQFDAANHLLDMRDWERAEQVLLDFRERYPNHELVPTIPAKLAMLYQESEQWHAAAEVLSNIAANDEDVEIQRDSLYLAAELYERAGDLTQAIVHYRRYAHTYGEPFDLATEARYNLVELYEQLDEPLKRNFWLQKLIDAHEQARESGASTDRARYLAAYAARELAAIDYHAFSQIKLTLPIQESLQRKKAAMEKTLQGYRRVLNYGIGEFTTEANNRIGMVYAELSEDLMESERPDGLNALELEQYEILLEEQAFPFEEKAIEIHAANAKRSWQGTYDDWVKDSFEILAELLPARYNKPEARQEVSDEIY